MSNRADQTELLFLETRGFRITRTFENRLHDLDLTDFLGKGEFYLRRSNVTGNKERRHKAFS